MIVNKTGAKVYMNFLTSIVNRDDLFLLSIQEKTYKRWWQVVHWQGLGFGPHVVEVMCRAVAGLWKTVCQWCFVRLQGQGLCDERRPSVTARRRVEYDKRAIGNSRLSSAPFLPPRNLAQTPQNIPPAVAYIIFLRIMIACVYCLCPTSFLPSSYPPFLLYGDGSDFDSDILLLLLFVFFLLPVAPVFRAGCFDVVIVAGSFKILIVHVFIARAFALRVRLRIPGEVIQAARWIFSPPSYLAKWQVSS